MSFKTIVVHVDADTNRDERLNLAEELVRRHDGHLIGLHPPASPDSVLAQAVTNTRQARIARRRMVGLPSGRAA